MNHAQAPWSEQTWALAFFCILSVTTYTISKKQKTIKKIYTGMKMKVGVVMGSTSDLGVMKGAFEILDQFGVEYEKKVFSAHRTPVALEECIKEPANAALWRSSLPPAAQPISPASWLPTPLSR